MASKTTIIPAEPIDNPIHILRGQKAVLSSPMAVLYCVEAHVQIQDVKRNLNRFSKDFMLQFAHPKFANLKSQFGISSWGELHPRSAIKA